jgi:hypothetical protein
LTAVHLAHSMTHPADREKALRVRAVRLG